MRTPLAYPLWECNQVWLHGLEEPVEAKKPESQDILPVPAGSLERGLLNLGHLGLRQVRASILSLLWRRATSGKAAT